MSKTLRDYLNDAIAVAGPNATPREIARAAVKTGIPTAVLNAWIEAGLANAVAEMLRIQRGSLARTPQAPRPAGLASSGTHTDPAGRPGPSAKVAAIRTAGPLRLDGRFVGANKEWKDLASFTRADCEAAATFRWRQAAGNIANAERFERLMKLLEDNGVETVGELPPDVLDTDVVPDEEAPGDA